MNSEYSGEAIDVSRGRIGVDGPVNPISDSDTMMFDTGRGPDVGPPTVSR